MSINDYWQKTLAYFGMADDGYDDYDEYDDYENHDRETNARVRDDDRRSRDDHLHSCRQRRAQATAR